MRRLFIPFWLAASLAMAGPATSRAVDLSGVWKGSFTLASTGHAMEDLVIDLSQSGKVVQGTLLIPKFRSPMPLSGTFAGGRLRLVSPPTRGLAVTLTALVKNPNKITGTAVLDYSAPNLGVRQDRTRLEMTR